MQLQAKYLLLCLFVGLFASFNRCDGAAVVVGGVGGTTVVFMAFVVVGTVGTVVAGSVVVAPINR